MAQLILVRHGQSLWNALNKFTGWVDVPLSERGRAEATIASCRLSGYRVNVCFTSKLIRAIETATICLTEQDDICGGKIPIIKHEQSNQKTGMAGIVMMAIPPKNCLFSQMLRLMSGFMVNYKA